MNINIYNPYVRRELELYHHGIQGQKWGKRNGPPYPLGVGDHSASEKKARWQDSLDSKSNHGSKVSTGSGGTASAQKLEKSDGESGNSRTVTDEELYDLFEAAAKKVGFIPTKEQNYERNKNMPLSLLPKSIEECKKFGWYNNVASNCHQFTSEDKSNDKWISPDGKLEVIFDKSGHIVTRPEDYGTYNFCDPISNPLGHFMKDVIPWLVWGNSPDDTTTTAQRFNSFFVNGTFSMGKKVYHAAVHK